MLGVHLSPQPGDIAVGHDDVHQSGVGHLQYVLGLEIAGRLAQCHRRKPAPAKSLIERLQALVVAGRATDVDLLAREIVERRQRRGGGPRDDQLPDVARGRSREVDDLAPLRRDRKISRCDITLTGDQQWQQAGARHGNEHHMDAQVAATELAVEIVLEGAHEVIADSALRAAEVDEV
jgi:hypothetical protein